MSTAADRLGDEALVLREDGEHGITTVTLNRPRQYNALSEALIAALHDTLNRIAEDRSVRVVVLAGAGKAFCSGHDLKELRLSDDRAHHRDVFRRCGWIMTRLISLPQPVIARVHGIATAAGCQLVASCDLAVASQQARFATSGIKVGLFCHTPGAALSRNIGRKRALEMLLTGELIDAETARDHGLVNRVVAEDELDAAVAELAGQIAAKPASAVQRGKQLFYKQLEMGLSEAYDYAAEAMACNLTEEETREGIDAFMEKRPPRWG